MRKVFGWILLVLITVGVGYLLSLQYGLTRTLIAFLGAIIIGGLVLLAVYLITGY